MLSSLSWYARILWGTLILGVLFLVLSPLVSRFGLIGFGPAFIGLAIGGGLALLAFILAIIRMIGPLRDLGRLNALFAMLIALGIAGFLGYTFSGARAAPMIHDITTDLDNPPQFQTLSPRTYDKPRPLTDMQRRVLHEVSYRDLKPLVVKRPVNQTTDAVAKTLADMGLEIASTDLENGHVEATDTTFWFGFKDDVIVDIDPGEAGGSVINIRSVSRVGLSDVGTNAKRIRAILANLSYRFS